MANQKNGFTLIELMMAVSVLMIGTLMIQQGFLRSAGLFHAASHRLAVETWMQTKLAHARERLVYADPSEAGGESGTVELDDRHYSYTLAVDMLPSGKDLYTLKLDAAWIEDGRETSMSKEAYAVLRDPLE